MLRLVSQVARAKASPRDGMEANSVNRDSLRIVRQPLRTRAPPNLRSFAVGSRPDSNNRRAEPSRMSTIKRIENR